MKRVAAMEWQGKLMINVKSIQYVWEARYNIHIIHEKDLSSLQISVPNYEGGNDTTHLNTYQLAGILK